MKVSLILLVYNAEKYLKMCLDSLLDQDFEDYEIVVVNDGSTDGTAQILKQYNSEKIKIFMNKANKPDNILIPDNNSARRLAISKARGQYLMHFLAHAVAERNLLSILASKLDKASETVACVGAKEIGNFENIPAKLIYTFWSTARFFGLPRKEGFVKRGVVFSLWRKKILEKLGGFPTGGDTELNLMVNRAGYKKFYTTETKVHYHWRASGKIRNNPANNMNPFKAFFWKMVGYGNCRAKYCFRYKDEPFAKYVLLSLLTFPFGYGWGFLLACIGVDAKEALGLA